MMIEQDFLNNVCDDHSHSDEESGGNEEEHHIHHEDVDFFGKKWTIK